MPTKWEAQDDAMRARADRVRLSIWARGRAAFNAAFGHSNTQNFECFHLAHNWQGLRDNTPAQNQACRYALYMQAKGWRAWDTYAVWQKRTWTQHCRERFGCAGPE